MAGVVKTQLFDFVLSRRECEALEQLIRSEGCKAKFKVLREARVEVRIEVELVRANESKREEKK